MTIFLLEIWFLLFLSNKGEEKWWICSLHSGFDEDDHGDDNISNFFRMPTWRTKFPNGDIKVCIMLPSWNKFLRSIFYSVVVSPENNKGLVRINLPLKSILIVFELVRLWLFLSWKD
jgi:hypothetical protein